MPTHSPKPGEAAVKGITMDSSGPNRISGYLAVPACGNGPGLLIVDESLSANSAIRETADYFAEEGYTVMVPTLAAGNATAARGSTELASAVASLSQRSECSGKVGAIGFGAGALPVWTAAKRGEVAAAVCYDADIPTGSETPASPQAPVAFHFAGKNPNQFARVIGEMTPLPAGIECYNYSDAAAGFYRAGSAAYHKPSAQMSQTRTLTLLRRIIGPVFDFGTLWDKHCEYEFAIRDVDATMATMVAEPYVNHIPTMTGGVGYRDLYRFYKHHFVPTNPKDLKLIPISRTIGTDRLVDEILVCFTHDREIDWMLPGVPPTGKYVEIPLVAIVSFRGDKLYHEHIYWDQASVLVQLGLLDPQKVPAAGIETARKLIDETLPSNTLMARWETTA